MQRCLQLAVQGFGHTAPNPMVGCVIVCEEEIIGEGYHREYGAEHAEVNAIHSVKDKSLLAYSTLYVNLEPCSHFGKTPPCSNFIIENNIPRVVIGSVDIHSVVAGKGIEKLQSAGVEVVVGAMQEECIQLNKRFFTFHKHKRPYIILKWAQTLDGYIDKTRHEGEIGINPITNRNTKRWTHLWRSQEDAILVGKTTVVNDNPALTVREVCGKNPIRIVIDKDLSLSNHYTLFLDGEKTIVFNAKKEFAHDDNLLYKKVDFNGTELSQLLDCLFQESIQSVIIEGGAYTLSKFIESDLWDEARVLTGGVYFESGLRAPHFEGTLNEQYAIETDHIRIFSNPNISLF